jgi:hypothetical protein
MKQGADLLYSRELARQSTKVTTEGSPTGKLSIPSSSYGQARLQDFMILRMIGKGTFGKVYMV